MILTILSRYILVNCFTFGVFSLFVFLGWLGVAGVAGQRWLTNILDDKRRWVVGSTQQPRSAK